MNTATTGGAAHEVVPALVVPPGSSGPGAWRRLAHEPTALIGGATLGIIVLAVVLAGPICALLGIDSTTSNLTLLNPNTGLPDPPWNSFTTEHPLGVAPGTGRDTLAQVLDGGRVSLGIAVLATFASIALGLLVGLVAGYRGGWLDSLLSRMMDVVLAFPVLLFSIALLVVFAQVDSFAGLSGNGLRLALLVALIGFFGFAYVGRVVRSQVLTLREREFVEAARAAGAGPVRIVTREILPNLTGSLAVLTMVALPSAILAEATLSFLGLGLAPPAISWGQMLSTATATFSVYPLYMIVPGVAIVLTVAASTLLGDGIRDALDTRTTNARKGGLLR